MNDIEAGRGPEQASIPRPGQERAGKHRVVHRVGQPGQGVAMTGSMTAGAAGQQLDIGCVARVQFAESLQEAAGVGADSTRGGSPELLHQHQDPGPGHGRPPAVCRAAQASRYNESSPSAHFDQVKSAVRR